MNVRYSTANVGKSADAQAFDWETPVPVNAFWDGISFCTSRNFLQLFTEEQLGRMPIDPDSRADDQEKLGLLLSILREQLAREEAAAAPRSLHEADFQRWNAIWLAIYSSQADLKHPDTERTVRMMADRRADKSNLAPLHTLAGHLLTVGKYKEAEEMEREVAAWMDGHEKLGRDSPQALSARRTMARALWGQGEARRAEAEEMVREIGQIVEGMGGGRFAVYQEEEREAMGKLVEESRGRVSGWMKFV